MRSHLRLKGDFMGYLKKQAIACVLSAAFVITSTGIPVHADETTEPVAVYRVYNPNSGEHFYTTDESESEHLKSLGWQYEGIGWYAAADGSAVYRLYNPNAGEHHYTTSEEEKTVLVAAGWVDEGEAWMAAGQEGAPVYRYYNPNAFANNHHFTTDQSEGTTLASVGWRAEDIAWYAVKEGEPVDASANANTGAQSGAANGDSNVNGETNGSENNSASAGTETGTETSGSSGSANGNSGAGTGTASDSGSGTAAAETINDGASLQELVRYMEQAYGLTTEQACGVAGNMYRESNCRAAVIEGGYMRGGPDAKVGFDNDPVGYAKAVADGTYANFTTDAVGYGIVQFTSEKMKSWLLKRSQETGLRVDSLQLQMDVVGEMINDTRTFKYLKKRLTEASTAEEAAYVWLTCYEFPGWANITPQSKSYERAQREGKIRGEYARKIANQIR